MHDLHAEKYWRLNWQFSLVLVKIAFSALKVCFSCDNRSCESAALEQGVDYHLIFIVFQQ